jgi:hypothetical protein
MFGPLSVGAIVGIIIAALLYALFNGGIDPGWLGWAAIGAPIGGFVGYLIENRRRQ